MSVITDVVGAIELLMYVIAVVFILVVVSMTGSRVLYQEKRDLGICKSLGFRASALRRSFALRFALTAVPGAVLGIVASACFTDPLATALLRLFGISRFTSELAPFQMLLPGAVVVVLFMLVAYVVARRIKRIAANILIVE